jgi:hypothetical protein
MISTAAGGGLGSKPDRFQRLPISGNVGLALHLAGGNSLARRI